MKTKLNLLHIFQLDLDKKERKGKEKNIKLKQNENNIDESSVGFDNITS